MEVVSLRGWNGGMVDVDVDVVVDVDVGWFVEA